MKSTIYRFAVLVLLFANQGIAQQSGSVSNQPAFAKPTYGYFKCKYGKLEIIDAVAWIGVQDEYSSTYGLGVNFCYKPMTESDIRSLKTTTVLPPGRQATLKVNGFPEDGCPRLGVSLGGWPIGKLPPRIGTNNNIVNLVTGGDNA